MKALQILLIILLYTTPLFADQALVLTEIEQIQEKIWHMQRAVATQKTLIEEHQKQLGLSVSKANKSQLELNKRLTALTHLTTVQQEDTRQLGNQLQNLNETLAAMANEVRQKNSAMLNQSKKIETLEGSLQTLRAELAAKQAGTEQKLAETHRQLIETRSQIDSLGQDVGGRIEKIGVWGAGAVLILVIALIVVISLTIINAGRKSKAKRRSPDREQPTKHVM